MDGVFKAVSFILGLSKREKEKKVRSIPMC